MTTQIRERDDALSAPDDHDRRRLDRSLVHGIAWTGGLKWVTQGFSWAATIYIARILSPADYGLVGLATLYIGLVAMVNELGLGAAIIRRRDLTDDQISAIGGISVAMGATLWAVSAALAPFVAIFFARWQVTLVLTVLSITFVTSGLKVIPRAILSRELQFRKVATIDAIEASISIVFTLGLAMAGYRYWSLVYGTLLGSVVSTSVALVWRHHPIRWPRHFEEVSGAAAFGSHIVISRIAWYLYSNADFAVVGKVIGTVALGAYNFGWTMASIPVDRISGMVAQVTPAVLSAVQNDRPALRRYLLRITEALAFITFPASLGLALVAKDFVLLALGQQWSAAVLPLRLLAFYAGFRSITTLFPHVLQAVGQSRRAMNLSLLALCILPPLFYVGASTHGAAGVAVAWIFGYPLVMIPAFQAVFEVTELRAREYFAAVWPALFGSLVMAGAVLSIASILPDSHHRLVRLVLECTSGALTYSAVMFALYRDRLSGWIALIKEFRR
ncbi:MAG: lipopolysaccharide biosynthesis protein [Gemmatimonadota bacterium]